MPLYDFVCRECGMPFKDVLLTHAKREEFLQEECPSCGQKELAVDMTESNVVYVPTPGTPEYEARVMKERYRKRNAQLDKLPPENQERMKTFMKKYGVSATAPATYTQPPKKEKKQ